MSIEVKVKVMVKVDVQDKEKVQVKVTRPRRLSERRLVIYTALLRKHVFV